jgi:hypothetical protein
MRRTLCILRMGIAMPMGLKHECTLFMRAIILESRCASNDQFADS